MKRKTVKIPKIIKKKEHNDEHTCLKKQYMHGYSNLLTDIFIIVAKEQGHQVIEINVTKALVHPVL